MINTESWFYQEGQHIGTLEAEAGGELTTETTTRRRIVHERFMDTLQSARPECMIDFRAGIKQAWKTITGSTRGAYNNAD